MRQDPRFITKEEILLKVSSRNELRPVWMSDMSKGGLFVQTADPPELRSTVSVRISTPEGALDLSAEVVHVVEPNAHFPGGVGLQFTNLDADKRGAIERYVEGLAEQLTRGDDAQAEARRAADEETLEREVRHFLQGFEQEDLYGAVGALPTASRAELAGRLQQLMNLFDAPPPNLRPTTKTRLQHAKSLLKKATILMMDPDRRLDFDFRHGHVHAEHRIANARGPAEIAHLRDLWHQLHRHSLQEAEHAAARALEHVNKLDYESALTEAGRALERDPFNMELRAAMQEWKHRLNVRNGPRPAPVRAKSA